MHTKYLSNITCTYKKLREENTDYKYKKKLGSKLFFVFGKKFSFNFNTTPTGGKISNFLLFSMTYEKKE